MRVFVHRTGTGITQIQRRRVTSRHAPTTRDAAPGPERGVPRRKPWIGDGQWEESTVPLYNGFCDTPRQKAKKGTLQAYTQTCIHAYSKMIKKIHPDFAVEASRIPTKSDFRLVPRRYSYSYETKSGHRAQRYRVVVPALLLHACECGAPRHARFA